MNDFRAVVAIFISVISFYLVIDLFISGFSWYVLFSAILGFLVVHALWPPKRDGESAWYEALQLIFDLPYRLIALSIRGIGRVAKDADGIGLDL